MKQKRFVSLLVLMLALVLCALAPRGAYAANDIMLGMFYNSDSDCTNSIYVGYDGATMTRAATTYDTQGRDAGGASVYYSADGGTHYGHVDPSIMYYGGKFWALSGWNRNDGKFWPMISYSEDLVHWTHPEGDGLINGTHGISLNVYPSGYSSSNKRFDTVAPEWFVSKNGSVYIVFSAGYYGAFHGQPTQDRMQAYVVKVSTLSASSGAADGSTKYLWPQNLQFKAGTAQRLNIPGNTATSANFIDGAMYSEGGKDYLVIKKDGLTNQLYSTTNIDANSWATVNSKMTFGYEGASIAKLGGTYYMVADEVSGTTAKGVKMFTSSSITNKSMWSQAGTSFVNKSGGKTTVRHGSIITLKQGTAGWKVAAKLVKAKLGASTSISNIANKAYTGKAIKPAVTVTFGGVTLKKGTDYTVSYKNNVQAGTATVVVTGKGSYTGTAKKTFKITKRNLAKATVTLAKESYAYTGKAIKPAVKAVTVGSVTFTKDTDYTVSYKNNKKRGTATVTITGKGSCTGTITKTFKIVKASVAKATVTLSATSYTYNGKAKKPAVKEVKLGSVTLKANTDYTVSYKNNVKAGTATVTITGKGNYKGTVNKNFTIKAKSLASSTVTLASKKYTYTGAALKPAVVKATLDTTVLKAGTDYKVSYKNNTNAGTATATITGKGNYRGTATAEFTIAPKKVTVTANNASKTAGQADPALTASVTGTIGTDKLTYTVARAAGEAVGTYAITAKGDARQGNYTVTFKPGTFTIKSASDSSETEPSGSDDSIRTPEIAVSSTQITAQSEQSDESSEDLIVEDAPEPEGLIVEEDATMDAQSNPYMTDESDEPEPIEVL